VTGSSSTRRTWETAAPVEVADTWQHANSWRDPDRDVCDRYYALYPDDLERYGPTGQGGCDHDSRYLIAWGLEEDARAGTVDCHRPGPVARPRPRRTGAPDRAGRRSRRVDRRGPADVRDSESWASEPAGGCARPHVPWPLRRVHSATSNVCPGRNDRSSFPRALPIGYLHNEQVFSSRHPRREAGSQSHGAPSESAGLPTATNR
jgi:hypothetical protein